MWRSWKKHCYFAENLIRKKVDFINNRRPDLLRDIVEYYAPKELVNRKRPFYRFIGQQEFENIFLNKKILFTDPVCWRDQASDPLEVYFETVEANKEHLRKVWKQLREAEEAKYKRLGIGYLSFDNAIFFNYVASTAVIQQKSFVYCVADKIRDKMMFNEYHRNFGRNIIIKFAPDFYAKLAMMKGTGVLSGDYLFADFMPMIYVKDMDEYIEKRLHNGITVQQIAGAYFDEGAFLKHSKFAYEHEYRMKLRIKRKEIGVHTVFRELYDALWRETDEETILDYSIKKIADVSKTINSIYDEIDDRILKDGIKDFFVIDIRNGLDDMIEKIYIHKGEDRSLKDKIRNCCANQKIPVEEADFENYLWMCSILE